MAKTLGGSPYVTKLTYNPNGDLSILASLSQVLGNLSYIFRLMHHDFYIWVRDVWYGYYQNPIIVIFTFLIPAFVFGSLLVKKKFSYYYFFIFMSLFSVFFMKGIADPFGEIFQLLFTHVRILEAFRNPFEKISIILPLFYALPFALGVYGFYTFTKKRWSHVIAKVATVAICVICFVVLGIPIWNGWVFTGDAVPSNNTKIGFKVQVPLYYKNASSWLDKQTEDYRVVALPLGGEGITYNWMYGYTGVEPSNGIFDKSFISYCTTIQFLCSLTQEIQTTVLNNPNDVWKMLSPLHSNYIMVRKDSNYQIDQMQNPSDLQNKLDVANNIQKVQSFGPLTFYSGNKSYDTPKIFAATQGIYIDGENSFISALPLADYKKNDVYFTSDILQDNTLSHSHQIVLQAKEFVPPQLKISKENALLELPYVRFLPGSPFYLWTRWRENFDNFLAGSSDVPNLVVQSDKRLVEAYKLLTLGKRQTADSTMGEYVKLLNYFYDNNIVFSEDKEKEDLLRQKYVLDDAVELGKNVHDTNPAYDRASYILNALLMDLGLNSLFPSDLVTNRVYEVNVPREGNYTVKIAKEEYKQYYPMDSLSGVIDEKKYFSAPTDSTDPFIIIGVFYFSKGQHQIAIQVQKNKNLFSSDTIRIKTKKTSGGISKNDYILPVKNLNPNGRYLLSFDYKIIAGNPFQLAFIEDTDITKNGIKIPHYNLSLSLQYTGRFNSWYHYEYTIIPNKISHNAHLLFQVYPTNQCEKMNLLSFLCNNSSYSQKFNQISEANIKNISLVREDIGNVFLTKDQTINSPYKQPHIVFTQKNSARYMINVSGATTPFYLTFLEAYHPLWRLYYLINGKKVTVNEANHLFVNSYANAWLLDKKGNYSLLLEFSPQSFFEIGTKISIMTFSILVTVMGIYIGKKLLKKKQ